MQRASASNKVEKTKRDYPDKLFYKIGEVSKITEIEPYVLRYWETEFPFLKPRKNKSGQRVYVKRDLEQIFKIKDLLYGERYTIEGVRKRLSETTGKKDSAPGEDEALDASAGQEAKVRSMSPEQALEHVKERLRGILARLE